MTVKTHKLDYSVSYPSVIDFGRIDIINVPQDGLLGSNIQYVDIICDLSLLNTTAEIPRSFIGKDADRYWQCLDMLPSQGKQQRFILVEYNN